MAKCPPGNHCELKQRLSSCRCRSKKEKKEKEKKIKKKERTTVGK